MITPIGNYTADTLRTAVLDQPTRRRRLTSMLNLLAEMDETSVNREFDRESLYAKEHDFAPTRELTNFEKVELIITDSLMPKDLETLLNELSEIQVSEPNSDYVSYEIIT